MPKRIHSEYYITVSFKIYSNLCTHLSICVVFDTKYQILNAIKWAARSVYFMVCQISIIF